MASFSASDVSATDEDSFEAIHRLVLVEVAAVKVERVW